MTLIRHERCHRMMSCDTWSVVAAHKCPHLTRLCGSLHRVGAESLLKVYGVKVDPDEFRAFAGMGEAYFLSGVAGKYGIRIDDIDKLKEVFYGIYLEKAADPTEDIGLPGK